jgi:hypothetical protein
MGRGGRLAISVYEELVMLSLSLCSEPIQQRAVTANSAGGADTEGM